jgi:hypothetical protein
MCEFSVKSATDYDVFQMKHIEAIRATMNAMMSLPNGEPSKRGKKPGDSWNAKFPKLTAAEYNKDFQDFVMVRYLTLCRANSMEGKKPDRFEFLTEKACRLGYVVLREFYFFMCQLESLLKAHELEGPSAFSLEGQLSILNNLEVEERDILMEVLFGMTDDETLHQTFFPDPEKQKVHVLWQDRTCSLLLSRLEFKIQSRFRCLAEKALKEKALPDPAAGPEADAMGGNSIDAPESKEAPELESALCEMNEVEFPVENLLASWESRPKRTPSPRESLGYAVGIPREKRPRFTNKVLKHVGSGQALQNSTASEAMEELPDCEDPVVALPDGDCFDKEMDYLNEAEISAYNMDWMNWYAGNAEAVSGNFPFVTREPSRLQGKAKIIVADPPYSCTKDMLKAVLRAIPFFLDKSGVVLFFTTFAQFGSLVKLVKEVCGPAVQNGLPQLVAEDVPLLIEEDPERMSKRRKLQVFQQFKAGFVNGMQWVGCHCSFQGHPCLPSS